MQMGIVAPLTMARASGASSEERAAMALAFAKIPNNGLPHLKQKSKQRATNKHYNYNESEFLVVAAILWASFTRGVRDGHGTMPPENSQKAKELVEAAYDKLTDVTGMGQQASGDLIADCVNLWTDPDDPQAPKQEPVTQYCAYLCGTIAASKAGNNEIDKTIYSAAFDDTKAKMQPMLETARCLNPRSADKKYRIAGAGC
jgi:hypothetical protein